MKNRIKNSQKRNEFCIKLVRELYRGVDGKRLSLQGRERYNKENLSLTYGEIKPESFLQILLSINKLPGQVFIDLGCGSGMALMTAAFSSCNFTKVWGIELLPELTQAAESVVQLLMTMIESSNIPGEKKNQQNQQQLQQQQSSSQNTLKDIIEESFQSLQTDRLDIEVLVDRICKRIGHREYKKLLKGFKSFKKYLIFHSLDYSLEGDEVLRIQKDSENNRKEEMEEIEEGMGGKNGEEEDQEEEREQGEEEVSPDQALQQPKRQHRLEVILNLIQSSPGEYLKNKEFPSIVIDCNDIFQVNWWEEGTIIYCASLLFSDEMMIMLLERVWKMKLESYFISLKPFPSKSLLRQGESLYQYDTQQQIEIQNNSASSSDKNSNDDNNYSGSQNNRNYEGRKLTLISDSFYRMSWQMARVYIYQLESVNIEIVEDKTK